MESTARTNRNLCEALIEAQEGQFYAEEGLNEVSSQFAAEVAGFGDAWPGAQHEVQSAKQDVARAADEVRWLKGALGLVIR